MLKNIPPLLVLALLNGCVGFQNESHRQLHTRFETTPATAELYLDGALYSSTAQKESDITLSKEELERGSYVLAVPEARWPSGAFTPQTTRTVSLESMSHTITIRHPSPDSSAGQFDRRKSHPLSVSYESDPPNAQLHVAGATAKATFQKTIVASLADFDQGYVVFPAATAHWPSGATTNSAPLKVALNGATTHQTMLLNHPAPLSAAGRYDSAESHTVSVRYLSEPDRALIFNDHDNLGRASARKSYTYSPSDFERGYMLVPAMSARWTSGALTHSGTIKVELNGKEHEYTFIRPEFPNLELDLNFIQQEKNRALAEKSEAEQQALARQHYAKMENYEKQKLIVEKDKLDALKKHQRAQEKHAQELLRLRKYEIDKKLKLQAEQTKPAPPKQ